MRELLSRGFHPCDGPDAIMVDGEKVKDEWVYDKDGYLVCPHCGFHPTYSQNSKDKKGLSNCRFCPNCGAAMTDEAVQMAMERLEVLHDNRT